MNGQVVHGFCGKRIPLCGRNSSVSIRRAVSSIQCRKLLTLFLSDRGAGVLNWAASSIPVIQE
jgi:hypothetical protein